MAPFNLQQEVSLSTQQLSPVVHMGDVGIVSHVYHPEEHDGLQSYEVVFRTHDADLDEEFFLLETELKAAL